MGGGERGGEGGGGEPGELFLQPGVRVGADGLLQVLPGEHTTPMFACTLRLPDGTSVESGRFRRKREAEQDAALRGLHKVGIIAPNFVLLKSFKSFLCTSLDLCWFLASFLSRFFPHHLLAAEVFLLLLLLLLLLLKLCRKNSTLQQVLTELHLSSVLTMSVCVGSFIVFLGSGWGRGCYSLVLLMNQVPESLQNSRNMRSSWRKFHQLSLIRY